MSETIGITQVGPTLDCSIERLREKVATRFPGYEVRCLQPVDMPAMAIDSFRKQYHSTRILVALEESIRLAGTRRMLGVVAFDLFVPGMNFVFGEARCPGRVGVISTYRLRADDESDLFEGRVVKEAVHEIGHMLGLKHCPKSSCVMFFSERLADTDRKEDSFCSECEAKVKWLEIE